MVQAAREQLFFTAKQLQHAPRTSPELAPLPHVCSAWRTVSLGFADPALYAVKRQLDAQQAVSQFKDMVGSMKNPMRGPSTSPDQRRYRRLGSPQRL